MSAADTAAGYNAARLAIREAIQAQGVTVPSGVKFSEFPGYIALIEGGDPVPTEPSAITSGQWATTAGVGSIEINITALPSDGGSVITALQYRVNGGPWVNLTGTGTGSRTVTGLTGGVEYSVQLRAVNAVGGGAASDSKSCTPMSAGSGAATWAAVGASTFSSVGGAGHTPARPAGITATSLLILNMTSIYAATRAGFTVPPGWTFGGEVYADAPNLGQAFYWAPGTVADAAWVSSVGMDVGMEMHRIDGANLSAPIRALVTRTATGDPDYEWEDFLSPSAIAAAGDLVMSHYSQHNNGNELVDEPTSGYTRRVDNNNPNRRSTITRDNVPAGATGLLSHNTDSAYQSRVVWTLVIAAA